MRISDWSSDVYSADLTLAGGAGDDRLYGDAFAAADGIGIDQASWGGNDVLYGGRGDDTVVGDAVSIHRDMIGIGPFGSGGDDRLSGGAGNDLLIGDAERMEGDFVSGGDDRLYGGRGNDRSEEHTSELQSLMRISYAVFCLTKKKQH